MVIAFLKHLVEEILILLVAVGEGIAAASYLLNHLLCILGRYLREILLYLFLALAVSLNCA